MKCTIVKPCGASKLLFFRITTYSRCHLSRPLIIAKRQKKGIHHIRDFRQNMTSHSEQHLSFSQRNILEIFYMGLWTKLLRYDMDTAGTHHGYDRDMDFTHK